MKIPCATYRLQFNSNFRFVDAERIVPYLAELGISHLYSSPQYRAREGSTHGYDVADPTQINPELGTEQDFERIVAELRGRGMGVLLDIVPNHMAASAENPWWADVLEYGRESPYASFFDIDWEAQGSKAPELQRDRVVVPNLADFYDRVLNGQKIAIKLDERGFYADVEGSRYPIRPASYRLILEAAEALLHGRDETDGQSLERQTGGDRIEELTAAFAGNSREPHEHRRDVAQAKAALWGAYQAGGEFRKAIDEALRVLNGTKGDARSFGRLHLLFSLQAYRLAYWRNAAEEVNYRRFFGLNDLVAVRIEDAAVFAARHARTIEWVRQGKLDGLRVDHIDGLRDPLEYLQRLQRIKQPTDAENSGALNVYTLVEKITSGSEGLPPEWPTAGTTGYDYLNAVNTLFIDAAGSRALETIYREFTGIHSSFSETWYVRKKQVMEDLFASDIRMLSWRLARLAAIDRLGADIPIRELVRGLKEVTACLTIYRTYCRDLSLSERDRAYLERAFKIARDRAPVAALSHAGFEFLKRVFLLEASPDLELHQDRWLDFILRWQQFTGAVMAKGLEDTAFFVHHGLISLNEVGCNPLRREIRFGVGAFHQYNKKNSVEHPFTMNATSTHDTKWSEDVRARINVLSEIPGEWKARLAHWTEINRTKKTMIDGRAAPSPNEEVLLYQSMLGIWPLDAAISEQEREGIRERIETFMLKAAREAKTHSSWVSPNDAHEGAIKAFIAAIFEGSAENAFLGDFLEFSDRIAAHGACNSLSQLLLKITSPGVPDFYQGSELWNFRLTDPDNRHAVDFAKRRELLDAMGTSGAPGGAAPAGDPAGLLEHWRDGRVKLFLTRQALNFRRANRDLFLQGEYLPLEIEGEHRESVCAFARRSGSAWATVVVPRLVTRLAAAGAAFPLGAAAWGSNAALMLPAHAPARWTNAFTGEALTAVGTRKRKRLLLGEIFSRLPFALLAPADAPATPVA
jgi:(1->4)-alpha-D-glucan 1-alpha-D-glucosylmutase